MKKNGFAVAGILYPLLVLFLCFMLLLLGSLMSERYRLDKVKNNILNEINGEIESEQFQNTTLYSWNTLYYTDAYKLTTYQFLEELGVTRIYQSLSDFVSEENIQCLQDLNAKGFDVYALMGDSSWYNKPNVIKEKVDKIKEYNEAHPSYPVKGMVLNVEFYLEDAWNTDPTSMLNTLIATYEEIIPYAHTNELKVILVLPNWLEEGYETELDMLIRISDGTSIMNYNRKTLIEGIAKEMEIAKKYNKSIDCISDFSYRSDETYLTYYSAGVLKAHDDWKAIQTNAEGVDLTFAYQHLEPLLEIQKGYKKYKIQVTDSTGNIMSNEKMVVEVTNQDKVSDYAKYTSNEGIISLVIPDTYAYEIYSVDHMIQNISTPILEGNEYFITVQLQS